MEYPTIFDLVMRPIALICYVIGSLGIAGILGFFVAMAGDTQKEIKVRFICVFASVFAAMMIPFIGLLRMATP